LDSAPLIERLEECKRRISRMAVDGRGPRMSIPAQWTDDDIFMHVTIHEAINVLTRASVALATRLDAWG
jgi:hypothetical protein